MAVGTFPKPTADSLSLRKNKFNRDGLLDIYTRNKSTHEVICAFTWADGIGDDDEDDYDKEHFPRGGHTGDSACRR